MTLGSFIRRGWWGGWGLLLAHTLWAAPVTIPNQDIHPQQLVGVAVQDDQRAGYFLFRKEDGVYTIVVFTPQGIFFNSDGFPETIKFMPMQQVALRTFRFVRIEKVTADTLVYNSDRNYWLQVGTSRDRPKPFMDISTQGVSQEETHGVQWVEEKGGLDLRVQEHMLQLRFPRDFLERHGHRSLEEYGEKFRVQYTALLKQLVDLQVRERGFSNIFREKEPDFDRLVHQVGIPDPRDVGTQWHEYDTRLRKVLDLNRGAWKELSQVRSELESLKQNKDHALLLYDMGLWAELSLLKSGVTGDASFMAQRRAYPRDHLQTLGFSNFDSVRRSVIPHIERAEPIQVRWMLASSGGVNTGSCRLSQDDQGVASDRLGPTWVVDFRDAHERGGRQLQLRLPISDSAGHLIFSWDLGATVVGIPESVHAPLNESGQKPHLLHQTFSRLFPDYPIAPRAPQPMTYTAQTPGRAASLSARTFIEEVAKVPPEQLRIFQVGDDRFFLIVHPTHPRLFIVDFNEPESVSWLKDAEMLARMRHHDLEINLPRSTGKSPQHIDREKGDFLRSLLLALWDDAWNLLELMDVMQSEATLIPKLREAFLTALERSESINWEIKSSKDDLRKLSYLLADLFIGNGALSWFQGAIHSGHQRVLEVPLQRLKVEPMGMGGYERVDLLVYGQRIQIEIPRRALMFRGEIRGKMLRPGFVHDGDGRWTHLCMTSFCMGADDILLNRSLVTSVIFRPIYFITSHKWNMQGVTVTGGGEEQEKVSVRGSDWLDRMGIPEEFRGEGEELTFSGTDIIERRGPIIGGKTDQFLRLRLLARGRSLSVADKIKLLVSIAVGTQHRSYEDMERLFFPEPSMEGVEKATPDLIPAGHRQYMDAMGLKPTGFDYVFGAVGQKKPDCGSPSIFQKILGIH